MYTNLSEARDLYYDDNSIPRAKRKRKKPKDPERRKRGKKISPRQRAKRNK